jgi:hypothetical protein
MNLKIVAMCSLLLAPLLMGAKENENESEYKKVQEISKLNGINFGFDINKDCYKDDNLSFDLNIVGISNFNTIYNIQFAFRSDLGTFITENYQFIRSSEYDEGNGGRTQKKVVVPLDKIDLNTEVTCTYSGEFSYNQKTTFSFTSNISNLSQTLKLSGDKTEIYDSLNLNYWELITTKLIVDNKSLAESLYSDYYYRLDFKNLIFKFNATYSFSAKSIEFDFYDPKHKFDGVYENSTTEDFKKISLSYKNTGEGVFFSSLETKYLNEDNNEMSGRKNTKNRTEVSNLYFPYQNIEDYKNTPIRLCINEFGTSKLNLSFIGNYLMEETIHGETEYELSNKNEGVFTNDTLEEVSI